MDTNYIEIAFLVYVTDKNGKKLFLECYYSGMTWKVYLENHGIIAIEFDLETAVSNANKWLQNDGRIPPQTVDLESLVRVGDESIDAYNLELFSIECFFED